MAVKYKVGNILSFKYYEADAYVILSTTKTHIKARCIYAKANPDYVGTIECLEIPVWNAYEEIPCDKFEELKARWL
jgi:hypothetical protein